jgi:hypothetical protein
MLLNSICHKQNTIVECTKDVFKTKEPQRHELSFSLQLSIDGKKPQQSLKELLENFQTYEIMNPSDKAKLSVCESEENPNGYFIKKKFDIVPLKTTEYFIISLKRYDENNRKIRNPVSDFKYIDIKGTLFLVVGCVVHMGDTGGGHYVYTVFKNGKIEYTLNDSVRTQMITENVISTDGFIFLYKRTTREQLNAIEDIKNHEDLLKHRKDFRDDVSPSLNADVKIVGYKIDGKSQFTTLIPI